MCIEFTEKAIKNAKKIRNKTKPIKAWKVVYKTDGHFYSMFQVSNGFKWKEGLNISNRLSNEPVTFDTDKGFHCFKFKKDAINFIKYIQSPYAAFNLCCWVNPNNVSLMEVSINPKDIVIIAPWASKIKVNDSYVQPMNILVTQVTAKLPKK